MDQPVGGPVNGVAARTDRVAQGAIGVALLAAFVFRVPWIVPGLAVVLAIGAIAGPGANGLHQVYERALAPRLPERATAVVEAPVAPGTVRAQDALAAVVLAIAGFAFVLGISLIGWLLALAIAVTAIVAATTRYHLADHLRRGRFSGR